MLWKKASPTGTDRQMEINVSGQTLGCILTFSHLAFTMCRYTHLFKERQIHTQVLTQNTTFSERTPTALQVLIYIQLEMSIYSSCNLRLWLLIPVFACVCPSVNCPFSVSDFAAIWYVRASLCPCERVVMCLGYQVCQTATIRATTHGEHLMAQQPAHPCSAPYFSFDSQTQ